MYVNSVRVRNYRSILDSGELHFSNGFNLIVGGNNVGKSSLLLSLTGKIVGEPHKSLQTLPNRDDLLKPHSIVDISVTASGDEVRRLLLTTGQGIRAFPWPSDTQFATDNLREVLDRILSAESIEFKVSGHARVSTAPDWNVDEYPATRLYAPLSLDNFRLFRFEVNPNQLSILPVDVVTSGTRNDDFGHTLSQLIIQRIYRFSAERLSLGRATVGANIELSSDAQNLAEVLNVLQGNPARFNAYCDLVRIVFPTIHKVTVRPYPPDPRLVEVLVWQTDPTLQRDDLATPLMQSGTGVGQVLAILYVVLTSERPRTIIIDEPGSFLHPGASRALISILKSFRQHQYIIATHSPEIVSELSLSPVTIIGWDKENSKSALQQSSSTTGKVAAAVLTEIGARLSDVFGFDKVLWVEGQSDALSLTALLDAVGKPQRRVGILPVRDTGSFRRRTIAEVMEIYRTLSLGDALLPPAVLFIFDRDGRTQQELDDAIRESRNKVRFWPRRMFENYLLKPASIAQLFNESGSPHGITTSADNVQAWIETNSDNYNDGHDRLVAFSDDWSKEIDGASLLAELFLELSEQRLFYKKTLHTPSLTLLVHAEDPEATVEILASVADVIE